MIDTLQLGNISMRGYIEYHLRSVSVDVRQRRLYNLIFSVLAITSLNFNFQVGAIQKDELKHGRIIQYKAGDISQSFFLKDL